MAIVVIYIVLGILYESFTHPLTILSGLPVGRLRRAADAARSSRTELSLYAFVGVIMLVGLVKKNGIMMVDFAVEAQREHGKSPREAIHEACLVRFRPIMMTTMAALVGTLPIALGFGAGAESRRPLGLAVVGGLLGLAAADALHHAGLLRVYRGSAAEARPQAAACRTAPRCARRCRGRPGGLAASSDGIWDSGFGIRPESPESRTPNPESLPPPRSTLRQLGPSNCL